MQAKSVLYAAVGAPVVAARKVSGQVNELKGKVTKETSNYSEVANKAIDEWAVEGEKVVSGIRDGKVVEEITQKVDLDQAKEQVSKLRDQLEDMLATWRQSFRPEKAESATAAKAPAAKTPASKAPASKAGATKTAAKPAASTKATANKTSAAKTTKSSTAAKTSSTKSTAKAKTS